MAKHRRIDTKFRQDNYISDLETDEKLLFIYLITNPFTNICWIYEINIKQIIIDTWIEKDKITNILLKFWDSWKIYYIDWWVYLRNFTKHQDTENLKIKKWINNGLSLVPSEIIDKIKEIDRLYIGYTYVLNNSNFNFNFNSNTNTKKHSVSETLNLWNEIENNKDIKISQPKQKILNIEFEKFRDLYNKKIWRPKAEKKRISLTDKERQDVMENVPKYISTIKDKQYQKHPMTYLNNRSREDEISWWIDYTNIQNFHNMMIQDKVPQLKQILWNELYFETKRKRKQDPLYLTL